MVKSTCSFEGCNRFVKAHGLCSSHAAQVKRGKPLTPIGSPKVPAEVRFAEKVTKTHGCWHWNAAKMDNGYGMFFYKNKRTLAHRASWMMHKGDIPDGFMIDHICHNRACVNPEHLRLATAKQNQEYLAGPHRDNKTSGVRGVHWSKSNKKWAATVTHHQKKIWVGSFDDLAEADAAVRAKRAELFTFPEVN